MNSLFSIMGLAIVRYLSVVRMQRKWHSEIQSSFWSSKFIWYLWGMSLMCTAPPLAGLGQYQEEEASFW